MSNCLPLRHWLVDLSSLASNSSTEVAMPKSKVHEIRSFHELMLLAHTFEEIAVPAGSYVLEKRD